MLEFRILGPLQVVDDDRAIELGGARQRAVLAILLLNGGETVSVDRIVDLMWGERPPATAVKTVQVYVSHLRRALVDDVLVSSKGGYALAVDSERVDALRFGRLVDEGRTALDAGASERAAELLRAGLALWRGPPLADLAFEEFVQDAAARLAEQRLEALELRIEADLRLGRHAEVVPELEGLVREHPLRERMRAQHMLALYRSGRQADALESFRDARGALVDELGLEPGRELRELEQAILEQDPVLDAPRVPGRESPQGARRRGLVLVAAGAALAVAAATVAVALSRSSPDVGVAPDSVAVIDPESDLVVADVPVGVRPEAIAADERSIWVANVADGTVMQVDMRKRRVVATLTPGVDVDALAAGAGSTWIADARRGRAVRVDANLGAVADSVPLPTSTTTGLHYGVRRAAIVSHGSLWVASSPLAAVLRVDARTKRVTGQVDVGNAPSGLAVADGAIWVADGMDNTVDRIVPTDTGAGGVADTIPLGNGPGPIAAGGGAVWVANTGDGTVSRIDPATASVRAEIPVGRQPTGIAVGAGAVWVANSLSGTVSRIDPRTNRVTKTIDVGGSPNSVAVAAGRVWLSVQEAPPRPAPAGGPSTVRMLLQHDPVATDPPFLDNFQLQYVSCGRLMTYDARAAKLVPQFAAAPPAVSADGRVYTFRVRSGYRFSPPSGRPVTAAAFERTIEQNLPIDDVVGVTAYKSGRADKIAGVSARGDRLTIRLTRPSPTLVARMASFSSCAVPPDAPARPRGLEQIATAGPYYVAAVTPKRRILLRRNPGYPAAASRGPEAIEVTIGATPARAIADVEAGRADFVPEVPPRAQARLVARYGPGSPAAKAGRQQYFSGPSPAVSGFVFNPRRPLFARAAMRQAVNYAIDRRALAQHPIPAALAGRPTDQLIPPGWPGYRDAAIYPLGGPNLAVARRLVGGGRHRGVLYTCNQSECLAQAELVRENLASIGIELEIRRFSFGNMFARLENRDEPYDISETGWIGWTPDPSEFADVFFGIHGSTAFLNRMPRVRNAIRLTGAARIAAYAALDRDIAAQDAPFAPAVSATHTDFFSARIGCQLEHPIYGIDLASLCVRD